MLKPRNGGIAWWRSIQIRERYFGQYRNHIQLLMANCAAIAVVPEILMNLMIDCVCVFVLHGKAAQANGMPLVDKGRST